MKQIKGKYNNINIYTDVIDDTAYEQLQELSDLEIFKHSKIAIMPDVHAGASCTIGTTMTIKDKIIPNMVGVDIGCGLEVVKLKNKKIDFAKLDNFIKRNIPSSFDIRNVEHEFAKKIDLSKMHCFDKIKTSRGYKSIGTLGGGNHFIEIDIDEEKNNYLVVHSGSRNIGLEVAEFYQNEAYQQFVDKKKDEIIKRLTKNHKQKDIEKELLNFKNSLTKKDKDYAYVEGKLFDDYIHDMKIMQEFASLNRKAIVHDIMEFMKFKKEEQFTTIHNYIDMEYMILRKGAISARKGEKLIIPINMRDGSLICLGKGNKNWNYSAPHGAGRLISRTKAKKILSMQEFKKEMEGIYSTTINKNTIDESPMAYKNIDDIINNIKDTVDIIVRIKPVYNFKASE